MNRQAAPIIATVLTLFGLLPAGCTSRGPAGLPAGSEPLVAALVVVALIAVRLVYVAAARRSGRVCLRLLALATLVSGWALYYVGFCFGGTATSIPAYSVRPLIASLGMFVGSTGYQELSPECTRSTLYMTLFAIVHLAAILVSAVFVVDFFWRRSKSYLRGLVWSWVPTSSPLDVFFGLNEPNILLARDLQATTGRRAHILFIDIPAEESEPREGQGLSQLFGFSAYNRRAIARLSGVRYAVKGALGRLPDVDAAETDVLGRLNLHVLKRLMARHRRTRFFFLSADETGNVKSVIALMQDVTCRQHTADIYCHARRSRANTVAEKMAYLAGTDGRLNVHLVDSSSLAVQLLRRNVGYQPVSYVAVDTRLATVVSPFTALVVGFGETGRDAVRFLYEFGAFVGPDGGRSPFKCYAVDSQMHQLRGSFLAGAPALRGSSEVELRQLSVRSPRFWPWVEELLPRLNYVVVALGNDHDTLQTAVGLFETACRVSPSTMGTFRIFMRSYAHENESLMEQTAAFYNSKCGLTGSDGRPWHPLVVFGRSAELFTCKTVIDDEALDNAKVFYAGYAGMARRDETWDYRHRISPDKDAVSLSDINAVIRKEAQDIANSQHMDTKLKLIGLTRREAWRLCHLPGGSTLTAGEQWQKQLLDYIQSFNAQKPRPPYVKSGPGLAASARDQALRNLAVCEHLRWSASHQLLGYLPGPQTDECSRRHSCLKPWSDLPGPVQDYDYNVVEKTVELIINQQNDDEQNNER